MKRVLKFVGYTLLILLVLLISIPFLFKSKIEKMVKEKINENLLAKVDFKDVDISAIRHFPKLSVSINNISIVGINDFDGDTLLAAQQVQTSMNLWKAITKGDVDIYSINIDKAMVNAIVNKAGKANWNITKDSAAATNTSSESKATKLQLDDYSIKNSTIKYSDFAGNMFADLSNVEHSGSGNFAADVFTLKTKTTIEKTNFSYGGISYINNAKTTADADLQMDTKASKYSFNTDKIAVNNLQLAAQGFFQINSDNSYGMDIQFKTPSTEFKNILSLIPAVYQNNFESVKTSGNAAFNGFVKGNYSTTALPAYQVNLNIDNGTFQYPDLPTPVKDINIAMKIDNPDGVTDHTVIDVSKGHISLAGEPFDFKLLVKNPMTNLYVDAFAKGKLDLNKISQYVKMPNITALRGLLQADFAVNGSALAIQKKQFNQFNAKGNIDVRDFYFASKDYPDGVGINTLQMMFNPQNVTLSNMAGKFKQTNYSANGFINNLLPYMFSGQPLDGVMNVKADNVNLNELMGVSTDTATKGKAESKPFIVPKNLNLTLNAAVDKLHYDKIDMQQVAGSLQIANETVNISNVKANALDGQLAMTGYYTTKMDTKKPDVGFTYNVSNVDIQKTFYAFNTVQKLMPVGQFLAGKLTSQLKLVGKLGDNMMPDMNTLTGDGNLLLLEGLLSKFAPVEKIAQTLSISQLQQVSLKDIKSYFQFTEGKVFIKPFNVKVKDIDMEIGGTHSFAQLLDYTINMKVPRAAMGANGNTLINNFTASAAAKGLPIKVADVVNVQVKMGGTISNPTVKTDLKQTATSLAQDLKLQAQQMVQNKIDSTKAAVTSAVKDTIKAVKNQVINDVKNQAIKEIFKTGDTTNTHNDPKKRIEDAGKNLLKDLNPFKKN